VVSLGDRVIDVLGKRRAYVRHLDAPFPVAIEVAFQVDSAKDHTPSDSDYRDAVLGAPSPVLQRPYRDAKEVRGVGNAERFTPRGLRLGTCYRPMSVIVPEPTHCRSCVRTFLTLA